MTRTFDAVSLTRSQVLVVLWWLQANGFDWLIPLGEKITVRRGWISAPAYYFKRGHDLNTEGHYPIALTDQYRAGRAKVRQVRVRVPFPSKAFQDAGLQVTP